MALFIDMEFRARQRFVLCRDLKTRGFELFLWSARGGEYAARVAKDLGIEDLFSHYLGKPGYVLDDEGWNWIRFTRRMSVRDDIEQN